MLLIPVRFSEQAGDWSASMTDYTKASDEELIAACLRGDSPAWEALLRRYQRLIYSIPHKYNLSPEDMADVFQSVCVALLQGLSTLRNEAKLGAWLITTTTRECWKIKRQQQQLADAVSLDNQTENPLELVADEPLPEEVIQRLEEQVLVRQSIEQLDERCRLLLKYLFYQKDEWPYEQIAKQLNMPPSSIGPTRGRCLDKLKRILKKAGFS